MVNNNDAPVRNTPNEPEEARRNWGRLTARGIEIIPHYLRNMGYKMIAVIGYTDIAGEFIKAAWSEDIGVVLYLDKDEPDPGIGVRVHRDLAEMLSSYKCSLIVDTNFNKFLLRRVYYDRFNTESCILSQLFMRILNTELFNWTLAGYSYRDEMLDELMGLLDNRYKNIALVGNSDYIHEINKRYSPLKHGVLALIPFDGIRITDSGRRFDILKFPEINFDAVIYIGVNSNVSFYKDNNKLELININSICQELAMSYDLATDVLPTLQEKGVKIFTFLYPEIYTLNYMLRARGLPPFKRKPYLHVMAKDPNYADDIKQFYKELYTPEYVQGILKRPSVIEVNGLRRYADFHTDFYNIVNGRRLTTHTPPETVHTVHFFGKCVAMGRYVEDKYTIASQLQRYICRDFDGYEVVNYGIEADVEINKKLKNIRFKEGDIVILLYRHYDVYRNKGIDVNYMLDLILKETQEHREFFLDSPEHFNHIINGKIAEQIFNAVSDSLEEYLHLTDTGKYFCYNDDEFKSDADSLAESNPELYKYVSELAAQRPELPEGSVVGSIVMNCNPFTLGHRYLIEQAASQCDLLYIFVVEENKSVFSFEDRFMLVKEGTADLDNVVVMPSGSFMISTLTFPEYFNKDNPNAVKVDPSMDVEIYGKYIAPALGISKRFAGEEPLDVVTNQYNETMKRILPSYGVEFVVIPRKESDGRVISASRVRECLKTKDFMQINTLVPDTTFRYLLKNFS
jgi:[citrate (pro-3S)-lyase] ligase